MATDTTKKVSRIMAGETETGNGLLNIVTAAGRGMSVDYELTPSQMRQVVNAFLPVLECRDRNHSIA